MAALIGRLRSHQRGHFFYRSGGKDVYLGSDPVAAVERWQRDYEAAVAASGSTRRPRSPTAAPKLKEAADALLRQLAPSISPERLEGYGYELAPLLERLGDKPLNLITAADLLDYRAAIIASYKPWSAVGRLSVARRVLKFAVASELVEKTPDPSLLKGIPIGETTPKAMTPEVFRARLNNVVNPTIQSMLRLQWLTCLRPFSVPELVHQRGSYEHGFLFVLDRSKTEKKSGVKQRVILTEAAFKELKSIKTDCYGDGRLYRRACITAGFGPPHAVRHSAAQALSSAGVESALIETALGHAVPGAARFYFQRYEAARKAMDLLAEMI
jgi:integrase